MGKYDDFGTQDNQNHRRIRAQQSAGTLPSIAAKGESHQPVRGKQSTGF